MMMRRAVRVAAVAAVLLHTLCMAQEKTHHAMEDEDQDGIMDPEELTALRSKLHQVFDPDASGRVEKDEMRSVLQVEHVSQEFNSLDQDADSFVSTAELDSRWDELGAEMTVDEVADWIAYSVQLPQYAQLFRDHFVSGYTFPLLMEKNGERLKELGIASSLHRQQLALMMKRKIAQVGRPPVEIKETSCQVVQKKGSRPPKVKVQWKPTHDAASHYQLQVHRDNKWHTLSFGQETSHSQVVPSTDDESHYKNYRLTTWNSFGRSGRVEVECDGDLNLDTVAPTPALTTSTGSSDSDSWLASWLAYYGKYWFWLDEAILLSALLFFPLRAFIYGDADFLLRLFRKLPPNSATRVEVTLDQIEAGLAEARLRIKWDRPADNGVPIVCYCVRWTDEAGAANYVKLIESPLPSVCFIPGLRFGETYKFTVESTNAFGLVSKSAQSTYMATNPVAIPAIAPAIPPVPRDQCYICLDPAETKSGMWNVGLHYCCVCDHQFCNAHKKTTSHSFIMHCPAINGKCVCSRCPEPLRVKKRNSSGLQS
ncbi:Aste57867_18896 [Aphanomyces stellatus]|uniref:Aste57867_18896 protein n=1 Tax=Aphanomyces stellatus TaxID=120398 RepID=A0A485LCZ4_9STRA|nr:hypothetical protein As57867_018832 [Aphanomyces stellatus]VFT95628.1 Aste57867_18896 [Aphanomyces stellatus]